MTRVAIEEVKKLQARLDEINAIPFDKIEWTENGQPIAFDSEVKTFFKFTGLSNHCYIVDGFYQETYKTTTNQIVKETQNG